MHGFTTATCSCYRLPVTLPCLFHFLLLGTVNLVVAAFSLAFLPPPTSFLYTLPALLFYIPVHASSALFYPPSFSIILDIILPALGLWLVEHFFLSSLSGVPYMLRIF